MALIQSFIKLNNGEKAPNFSLQGIDGKTYSLSDFAAKKGMLIIFMCNHCPFVKAKVGDLVKLYEKYGMNVKDIKAAAKRAIKRKK